MSYSTSSMRWTYLAVFVGINAVLLLLIGVGIVYVTDFYPEMTGLVIATWVLGIIIAMATVALAPGIFIRLNEDGEIRRSNRKVLPSIDKPSEVVEAILPDLGEVDEIPEDADIKRVVVDKDDGTTVYYK